MTLAERLNLKGPVGIDPVFYSYRNRENLIVIRFNILNDEMIDRYTGQHLDLSAFSDSVGLTDLWLGFRESGRTSGWRIVEDYLGLGGTVQMLCEMLAIVAFRSHGDLKSEHIYDSSTFQKMSIACDIFFDGNGKFMEYGPKFGDFLKRHNINKL